MVNPLSKFLFLKFLFFFFLDSFKSLIESFTGKVSFLDSLFWNIVRKSFQGPVCPISLSKFFYFEIFCFLCSRGFLLLCFLFFVCGEFFVFKIFVFCMGRIFRIDRIGVDWSSI